MGVRTSSLDTLARFERPIAAGGFRGAGKGAWQEVATEWASIQDVLPSRAEKLDEGMTIENRPARLRVRYRHGLTSGMRVVMGSLSLPDDPPPADRRIVQIISGPAVVGRFEQLEFMVEDYSIEGGAA